MPPQTLVSSLAYFSVVNAQVYMWTLVCQILNTKRKSSMVFYTKNREGRLLRNWKPWDRFCLDDWVYPHPITKQVEPWIYYSLCSNPFSLFPLISTLRSRKSDLPPWESATVPSLPDCSNLRLGLPGTGISHGQWSFFFFFFLIHLSLAVLGLCCCPRAFL